MVGCADVRFPSYFPWIEIKPSSLYSLTTLFLPTLRIACLPRVVPTTTGFPSAITVPETSRTKGSFEEAVCCPLTSKQLKARHVKTTIGRILLRAIVISQMVEHLQVLS